MEIWIWLAFIAFVVLLLALDFGFFHRENRVVPIGEALAWSVFWIALAAGFAVFVFFLYRDGWMGFGRVSGRELSGKEAMLEFVTGFLIEKSLAVDNLVLVALVLSHLHIPLALQHRVLDWAILGALLLRGPMIAAGAGLILHLDVMAYVFGGLLIVTAWKLLVVRHDNLRPERDPLVRSVRRALPVRRSLDGSRFLSREKGRRIVTRLGLALLLVASSVVLYAVDSIPAIFAVTRDPFLVFTSNVFGLLGLRSLYFALAGTFHVIRHLKTSLGVVLAFVGVKMILSPHAEISAPATLAVIAGVLAVGLIASLTDPRLDDRPLRSPLANELESLTLVGLHGARKVVVLIVGSTVILVGVAMVVLPGPAVIVIPAGIAILAVEFVWARRWLARFRDAARWLGRRMGKSDGRPDDEPDEGLNA